MVDYVKRLYKWLLIPWPLHLLLIFIIVHMVGLFVFAEWIDGWNLASSTFLQLFGGWFVIKTINDNLGIISSTSIMQSLRDYLRTFPSYKRKSITIQVEGISSSSSAGTANVTVNKKLKTTKEKVEFLFSEIGRLEKENKKLRVELVGKIDNLKSSVEDSIRNQKTDIENIRSKIATTLIGGAKEEALGILCIFYSLLIPYVTLLLGHLFRV